MSGGSWVQSPVWPSFLFNTHLALALSGLNFSRSYYTDITVLCPNAGQEVFTVSKIIVDMGNSSNELTWSTSDSQYEVLVDKKEFSTGSMKHAYRVSF